MTTDARLSTGLPAHPKTKKLIRRVGEGGAWALVCLILWARANRPDGDLTGMTGEDIELAVDWRGEADALVAALVAVGFLDGTEGAYHLHDWTEHQPWAAGSEARSEKARWASLCRRHGRDEAARQMPDYAVKIATSSNSAATSTPISATSSKVAVLDSASRTENACPVSVSVSVSKSKEQTTPNPSTAAEGKTGGRRKRDKVTFDAFLQTCHDADEKPIRRDDPIFQFAKDACIPVEFLHLAWREFAGKHTGTQRLQKDWRAHFRDAVRRNWFKLWWMPSEGSCELTTAGVQLRRELEAERLRQQAEDAAA